MCDQTPLDEKVIAIANEVDYVYPMVGHTVSRRLGERIRKGYMVSSRPRSGLGEGGGRVEISHVLSETAQAVNDHRVIGAGIG